MCFFLIAYAHHLDVHSFPTRRSSDLQNQFDADGRFLGKNGELAVIFATRGGARFPGKLYFKDGLCIRAEMERGGDWALPDRSEEHTSELQSRQYLVCRLLLEKKKHTH